MMVSVFSEICIEASGPEGPLAGTLCRPVADPGHVVLIVPGSGPTDRDGNNPLGIRASSYRLLAEALAAKNIATLRIDKRGMFGSARAVNDANAVTIADYVDDVKSWIAALRRECSAARLWLLGHSEGGLVALAAANDVDVSGIILVSTAAAPLQDVLKAQLGDDPLLLAQALPVINALTRGKRADIGHLPAALQNLFHPAVQGFLIDAFSYRPLELIASVSLPVLILQGERDLQVNAASAEALSAACRRPRMVLLPNVNHVLKHVASETVEANIAAYSDPHLPLAPGVAGAIAQFLDRHTAPSC